MKKWKKSKVVSTNIIKKTLLITGGSGFIARNLIENLSKKYLILSPSHGELELTNEHQVIDFFKSHKIDIVIHCANIGGTKRTINTPDIVEINLKIFFCLLNCKRYYKKMIFFGSGAEYDKRYDLTKIKENNFGERIPIDSYGFYKYICSKFIEQEENIINLRLFGVYGKYEDYETRFISYAICRMLLNKSINITKNVIFDYLYINDLVKIVDYFIENKVRHKFYNIGRGLQTDIKGIAQLIVKISSKNIPIHIHSRGLNNEYTCDITRLKKTIGKFNYTDFSVSIKELIDYYQSIIQVLKRNPNLSK